MLHQLVLVDLDLRVLGGLIEHELGAHGTLRTFLDLLVEGLTVGALRLEYGVDRLVVVGGLAEQRVQLLVGLGVDDALRRLEVDLLEKCLEDRIADGLGLGALGALGDLLLEVLLQLVESVELGGHLREVVICGGELALLHRVHLHGDRRVLTGVLAGDELGGEIGRLTGGKTLDSLL